VESIEPTAPPSADLRVAIDGEPSYFSPAAADSATSWITRLLYTSLLRIDNHGGVIPDLAIALPGVSADGLKWTVHLRTDATWSDGSPLTSADALFTFQIARSADCSFNPQTCAVWQQRVAKVEATDRTTIVITLKASYAPFDTVGLADTPIIPKVATEASYAAFFAGAGGVSAAEASAESAKIDEATGAVACTGATPPPSCGLAKYAPEMEALLTKAGGKLPDKTRFTSTKGAGQTVPDPEAYAASLRTKLGDLALTLAASQPDKIAAAYRLLDINLAPVTEGPYKFGSYTPGQSVELLRNDGYYRFKPGPSKVEIQIIKDPAKATDALKSGQIDFLPVVTSEAAATLGQDPNLKVSTFPDPTSYYYIAFNVRPGHAFAELPARQAFAMCIDQKAAVSSATGGGAIAVKAQVPPGSFFHDPTVPDYVFDPPAANELLKRSGWVVGSDGIYAKKGLKLKADLFVRAGEAQRLKFATIARDQVKKCGISLKVHEEAFSLINQDILDYPNKFDAYLGGWVNLAGSDDSTIFGCEHVTTPVNISDDNFTGFCDPNADALLNASNAESDRQKRKSALGQLQAYLHANGPYYFLWTDEGHRAYSAKVTTNGREGPIDYTSFYDFWNEDSWVVAK